MPLLFLQTLPSVRILAAALVLVTSALHFQGALPARGFATAMLAALPVVLACGALGATRGAARVVLAARSLAALLMVGPVVLWQVHDALSRRLPASLEGRDLEVVGVVDAMPQRFDFGDRVRFRLDACRVLDGDPDRDRPMPAAGGDCGTLERLQLDWGSPRAKDRPDGGGHRSGEDSGSGPRDDEDDAEEGGAFGAGRASVARAGRGDIWPEPGQTWRLTVRLKRPVATANPGGFDLELRYLQQGIGGIGRVYARQRLSADASGAQWRPGFAALVFFESQRSRLRDRLESVYARLVHASVAAGGGWPLLGVVAALALGDQGAIEPGLWGLFSRTGVSHLMAISGMHVTMLALIAAWVAARLLKILTRRRIPFVSRLLGSCPRQVIVLLVAVLVAFGYALLSGWGIPSQRTCWMLTAAAFMSLSGRGRGALDVTLLAAGIVILVDPWAPSTAGFWLSFGAVAAILWCAHGQESWWVLHLPPSGSLNVPVPKGLRDAMTSQWAATVGLAPLVVALFSILSLIGPLANAVAIPWVSFIVTPLAVVSVLTGPLSEPIAAFLVQVNLWMIGNLIAMLRWLDELPAASIAITAPAPWTLVAALVGAAVLIAPAGVPMRGAGVLCLLPMLFAPGLVPQEDELWITVLDIGQGSSILVEAGGQRLLFDTGSGSGPERSAAARHLVPYLRSRGIETIDTLVISHLDAEHAGGAATVLQNLRPARLVTGFDPRLLQAEAALLAGANLSGCTAGRRFGLGRSVVEVLHPASTAASRTAARDNAGSCVLRIVSPAGSVLLPGDLPATAEASLVSASRAASRAGSEQSPLRAEVLVVPQQGGRQATSAVLLAAVRPSLAVLQVGYRNRHRHPHPEVLARLSAAGATVLRTDLDGAIQVRLRPGRPPDVRRVRRDSPPYWRIEAAGEGVATAPSSRRRSPRTPRAPGRQPANTGRPPARRSVRA